jgi:hypothetical protein
MGDKNIDTKKADLAIAKLSETVTELIAHIDKGFGEIRTKIDSVQNSVNLVYADREILLNISGKIAGLHDETLTHRQFIDNANKDIKADIGAVSGKVDVKVEEIKKSVEGSMGAVVQAVEAKKSVVMVHDNIFAKIKRQFFNKGVSK